MIYFTTASVKYWCNFRLPSWQYGRIYGGLPRGVASSETWAPDSRFTVYTKKQNKMRLMNWRCKVIWVSSNGSYRGIFAEIEMCLRGKQFFLMIKNRTKCYEGPSKQKKNKHKNKKHQKKKLRIITFKTIIVFFEICFRKTKILLLRILKQCQML